MTIRREARVDHELARNRAEVFFGRRRADRGADRRRGARPVRKSKFYGAFVLNRRVVLHAIDATPARRRGGVNSSPLDRARTAASSPRNELSVHPTHWLISTQVDTVTQAVRSVLWQTHENVAIVYVDDGSRDATMCAVTQAGARAQINVTAPSCCVGPPSDVASTSARWRGGAGRIVAGQRLARLETSRAGPRRRPGKTQARQVSGL